MKYIIAIIQPDRLNDVMDQLAQRDVQLVTVTQILGHGRQGGQAQVYRGHKEQGRLLRKMKLEIAVNEEFVQPTIDALTAGARSVDGGAIGDGKIFVLDLQEVIRIRTGETGSGAIG